MFTEAWSERVSVHPALFPRSGRGKKGKRGIVVLVVVLVSRRAEAVEFPDDVTANCGSIAVPVPVVPSLILRGRMSVSMSVSNSPGVNQYRSGQVDVAQIDGWWMMERKWSGHPSSALYMLACVLPIHHRSIYLSASWFESSLLSRSGDPSASSN
jgi:hypothetical protein